MWLFSVEITQIIFGYAGSVLDWCILSCKMPNSAQRRSNVWNHVIEIGDKFQCKYCSQSWSKIGLRGYTSTILRHIRTKHYSELVDESI